MYFHHEMIKGVIKDEEVLKAILLLKKDLCFYPFLYRIFIVQENQICPSLSLLLKENLEKVQKLMQP